jgi:hypothetical protein
MSKTFTIAGIATKDGQTRLHVSNGSAEQRTTILGRQGWTDITFVTLPEAMEREAAVSHLASLGMVADISATKTAKIKVTKTAKPAKATKADVVKVTKSKKRVGEKPRAGQSVEEFVNLWFATKQERARAKFPEIFN